MKYRIVAAIATAVVLGTASSASAATPVYQGTGWKIANQYGVYATSPTQQFTVTFSTQAIKDRWGTKLTTAISQLNTLGLHITVGGIEAPPAPGTCPVKGHVNFSEKFQPLGQPGYSQGLPCYNTTDHSSWGGVVFMDSEIGDGTWHFDDWLMYSAPVHEMGHALGLDHPNTDLDGDGVIEAYECPYGTEGAKPVMCSPNGGFHTQAYWGRLSDQDRNGFKQLLTNASILGIN
jgi:hypothetical protein